MHLEEQLLSQYGIKATECTNLNTLANDVFRVDTSAGSFALKLYNPKSRTAPEIEWEVELVNHMVSQNAPIAKPIKGQHGYLESFTIDGSEQTAVLFEWADGDKPAPSHHTYVLMGRAAAQIHQASDSFSSSLPREVYDEQELIDEQLRRMQKELQASGQWERVVNLSERMKSVMSNKSLDFGICHMDLTLDNIHRDGDKLIVFDFDSAGICWRAIEPSGVLRFSDDYFKDWLEGYRSVRPFSEQDEKAVWAFGIINDIRNVVWKLGLAKSSRGKPLLEVSELPTVVDEWLEWEEKYRSK